VVKSSKKCDGSNYSGSVDGKPIRTVWDALLNTLMRPFFIEIDTIFGNQALQMPYMKYQ
jgi:hypothetical protein